MVLRGYSAGQIRAAEAPLLAAGIPLMLRAASGLADVLRSLAPRHILALVGSGDNGGDALFAVAELAAEGVAVTILPTGDRMHEAGLAAALAAGAVITESQDAAALALEADVLVDGILGTGASANPALRGRARELVAAILPVLDAPAHPTVVAVDLPSGIHPDDGSVPDPTVLPADVTVTFGGVKAGLLLEPGRTLAGDIRLVKIGLDLTGIESTVTA